MKIQILIKSNSINLTYDGLSRNKPKNKTFKGYDFEGILNFAITCSDRYVESCSSEVLEWAIKNNHDILKKKCWLFC